MNTLLSHSLLVFAVFYCCSIAAQELVGLFKDPDAKADFSGSWQKDYRRSDNWEQKLRLTVNEMRYEMRRQQPNGFETAPIGASVSSRNAGNRVTIVDLARFTELISRHNDLFISQTPDFVQIKRDGEADLVCSLNDQPVQSSSDDFGSEICVWNEDRLIFIIELPDNIKIRYQFVVSEDRSSINMMTNVSSKDSLDFELVQFFNRYESPTGEFDCKQTLSKGKVCTRSSSPSLSHKRSE